MIELAAKCNPTIVAGESVQQAFTQCLPLMRRFHALLEEKAGHEYGLYHVLHDSYAFGGPAVRRRYFLVASRAPFGVERPAFIPEDERVTVADVWGDLVDQPLSWQPQPYVAPPTGWSAKLRASEVDGHDNPVAAPDHFRTLDLLHSVGWEVAENQGEVLRRYYEKHGDLPESWQRNKDKIVESGFKHSITSPGRWRWDGPGRVIMGNSLDSVLHPLLPRFITHREAARMMGFPDDWRVASLNPRRVRAYYGKGITVPAGRWAGEWTRRALEGNPGEFTGVQIGERERVINVTHDWHLSEEERARRDRDIARKFGVVQAA